MISRKLLIVVLGVITMLLVLAGCSSPAPVPPAGSGAEDAPVAEKPQEAEEKAEELPVFTMAEVARFDGKEGRDAYIVVDGVVYDVTSVSQWHGGAHFGFEAGKDVSEALAKSAPHGASLLRSAKIVGTLQD